MKLKNVINIFGAPGVGKSTLASGLFYMMKINGFSVEFVQEYAKECVFEERFKLIQEDQLHIFANQNRKLFRLKDSYDYVIMDSPIILSNTYLQKDSFYDIEHFKNLVTSTFHNYPNINYFINLNESFNFENEGRVHSFTESKHLENEIKKMLTECKVTINEEFVNSDLVIDYIFKDIESRESGIGPVEEKEFTFLGTRYVAKKDETINGFTFYRKHTKYPDGMYWSHLKDINSIDVAIEVFKTQRSTNDS
jgi:thymidylate kinase